MIGRDIEQDLTTRNYPNDYQWPDTNDKDQDMTGTYRHDRNYNEGGMTTGMKEGRRDYDRRNNQR